MKKKISIYVFSFEYTQTKRKKTSLKKEKKRRRRTKSIWATNKREWVNFLANYLLHIGSCFFFTSRISASIAEPSEIDQMKSKFKQGKCGFSYGIVFLLVGFIGSSNIRY